MPQSWSSQPNKSIKHYIYSYGGTCQSLHVGTQNAHAEIPCKHCGCIPKSHYIRASIAIVQRWFDLLHTLNNHHLDTTDHRVGSTYQILGTIQGRRHLVSGIEPLPKTHIQYAVGVQLKHLHAQIFGISRCISQSAKPMHKRSIKQYTARI